MNRNVAIVTLILVLVVIAGYLVWLRSRNQQPVIPVVPSVEEVVQVSPSPEESASPSASPAQATGSARQRTSTPSSTVR